MRFVTLFLQLVLLVLGAIPSISEACTSIIVGKKISANGKTMIARTSDTIDSRRAKNFQIYFNNLAEKIYTGLPYADLENDPSFDMPQVATNRYGVSVSATETIQSSPNALWLDPPSVARRIGVSEPNIPSIVMPNAKNAKEAVLILGAAIEQRGVYGDNGFGVLIADHNSAWYLETLSGHQWVAIQIPDDVYFVAANGPGQIQEYLPDLYTYEMSHYQGTTPIEFAKHRNIAVEDHGAFNFRSSYADIHNPYNRNVNYVRIAYIQHYFNPHSESFNEAALDKGEYPMFLKPEQPITLNDIETLQASHYEDFPNFDPYTRYNKNEHVRPFYYPISNVRTSNGHVTVLANAAENEDLNIANVEYIALGMPTVSIYFPIYFGLNNKPAKLTGASHVADNTSLFWEFRKLQALAFFSDTEKGIAFDFKKRIKDIRANYAALTININKKQHYLENKYVSSPSIELIEEFTNETLEAISNLNKKMIAELMDELGIDQLYNLQNDEERNTWFTEVIHQQDNNYRKNKIIGGVEDALSKAKNSALFDLSPYVDKPVL